LRGIHGESDGLRDAATVALSLRLPPGCDTQELREHLRELAGEAEVRFAGDEPAYRAPKNTPLVRAFLAAIRARGGAPAFALKTGTSDMNVVGPVWGCPILAYGPGDSALDHSPPSIRASSSVRAMHPSRPSSRTVCSSPALCTPRTRGATRCAWPCRAAQIPRRQGIVSRLSPACRAWPWPRSGPHWSPGIGAT